jgi:hypothetical protein
MAFEAQEAETMSTAVTRYDPGRAAAAATAPRHWPANERDGFLDTPVHAGTPIVLDPQIERLVTEKAAAMMTPANPAPPHWLTNEQHFSSTVPGMSMDDAPGPAGWVSINLTPSQHPESDDAAPGT